MRRARAEAARRRAEAERADEGLEGVEAGVAAKRKQAAGIHKQRALLERKVAKRRAEMEKKVRCHALPLRAAKPQGGHVPNRARDGMACFPYMEVEHTCHPSWICECVHWVV